jgi:hypothetical protein
MPHTIARGRVSECFAEFCPCTNRAIEPNHHRCTMQRSAAQVLEDHLRLRQAGELDTDLEQNYAADVILLCDRGPFQGRDAVRKSGDDLKAQLPDGRFEYVVKYVTGEYAYVQWTADSATNRIEDGADTFVIRNGRIPMQSIFYRLKPRGLNVPSNRFASRPA